MIILILIIRYPTHTNAKPVSAAKRCLYELFHQYANSLIALNNACSYLHIFLSCCMIILYCTSAVCE